MFDNNTGVFFGVGITKFGGAISRAVVDEDDLEVGVGLSEEAIETLR